MRSIAVLLTCYNRKAKTLQALESLLESAKRQSTSPPVSFKVFLTDDGSTDGTAEAVLELLPTVHIIKGTGNLFWAEGMRWAWEEARIGTFDGYLLLNDDTNVYPELFDELVKIDQYSLDHFGTAGVYIGATEYNSELTYSGALITNAFLYKQKRLIPNGMPQKCDIGNANILYVSKESVEKVGIMTKGYAHGMGDYDYTLKASRKGVPVLLSPLVWGECPYDHDDYYSSFASKSLKERRKYVYHPLGLDFKSHLKFVKSFFPLRAPLVWLSAQFKIYFPQTYIKFLRLRTS